MSLTKFNQLVDLLQQVQFPAQSREGSLLVRDAPMLAELRAAVDDDDLGLVLPDADIDDVTEGQAITVQLLEPRLGIGIFATDFDDFLRSPAERMARPRAFYILGLSYSSQQQNAAPPVIERYDTALTLISILRDTATYVDDASATLVYLDKERFNVPIRYRSSDLEGLDVDSAMSIASNFQAHDSHRDQKLAILGQAIQDLTKNIAESDRFSFALKNLKALHTSLIEGYRLFAASFSYAKIKGELEAAKVEYAGKIHKAIADIQNQLLGLPVATVIVATQMKATATVDAQFWTNLAVLAGAWIFVALLGMLLRNQFHTLTSLEQDIKKQHADLEAKYSSIAPQFEAVFDFLKRRLSTQRVSLWLIAGVALFAVALGTFFFVMLSAPALEWVKRATVIAEHLLARFL
ncbi:hypothetical protein BGV56_18705 [Burkholderia ubonensis]|uniref:hypothetical protein n=1 Tax=Burkholderia ubonensis TaxID=101571 RepID=UPI0008FE782B|nr:hypothetical protein [Burkholderia ubonensis]OJB33236.1 hypothetical protein BGV56_18705 [Burkholderia ubonensis]